MDSDDSSENEIDSEDEIGKVNVDEFPYGSQEMRRYPDGKCYACGVRIPKVRRYPPWPLCAKCIQVYTINKQDAQIPYCLEDRNLNLLSNFRGLNGICYLLKDIRLAAIKKRFGFNNPSYGSYISCVHIILLESND